MAYLFLLIALLCGATKGFCGKKVSGYTPRFSDAALVSFLRMILCIGVGAVIVLAQGVVPFSDFGLSMFGTSVLSAVSTAGFVVLWLMAVRTGAYVMLDIAATAGMGVNIALCAAIFGEPVRPMQIVGFAILLVAVYVMCSYSISLKGRMSLGQLLVVIGCGLASGLSDFSQKLFVYKVSGNSASFNFYTYVFSAVILLVAWVVIRALEKRSEPSAASARVLSGRVLLIVFIMAVCLFLNSYFKTLAAESIDAMVMYPLMQGSALTLSLIMSAVFFGEKITKRCVAGVCLAFAAMLMINFL